MTFIHFETEEILELVVGNYSGYHGSPEDLLISLEDLLDSGEIDDNDAFDILSDM